MLLLVVLSMLVLFMLIGTAFLMTSNQSRTAAKGSAKKDRLGNLATRLLDRAVMQVARDTDNPNSVIRYHSLLRDLYGTNGFQAAIYSPPDANLPAEAGVLTRFSGGTTATPLGQTNGQFIDLYVQAKGYSATDYLNLAHVLTLDRNILNQPRTFTLPLTKGYFNGSLLTLTSGPAAGRSSRILDYDYMGEQVAATATVTATRLFRIRVLAFPRADGQPLQLTGVAARTPEIMDLAGQTFIVNGRAFGGTGVGYNPMAVTGQPRLSALQLIPTDTSNTKFTGAEIALLPNASYLNFSRVAAINLSVASPTANPFVGVGVGVAEFNAPTPEPFGYINSPPPVSPANWPYQSFVGSGGANEGYDAADFQNTALALQTVTPRNQGSVVHTSGILSPSDPRALTASAAFLRIDLEDVPLPSFHRPDLMNFWNHRLVNYLMTKASPCQPDDAVRGVVQPYLDDKWTLNTNAAGLTREDAAVISAIKRQTMFRPIREDHPHFDGSNPDSVPPSLAGLSSLFLNGHITIPLWESMGQWDVDNDNDGVRDSIWVDLGDPIQQTEDGRRYKTLYAILCIDLDSRLNVNAHGLAEDLHLPFQQGSALDPPMVGIIETPPGSGTYTAVAGSIESGLVVQTVGAPYTPQARTAFRPGPNLAGSSSTQTNTSQKLASGSGYGPAEISLRPVFPIPLTNATTGALDLRANRSELANPAYIDSYASLLVGRERSDGQAVPGRYGFEPQGLAKPLGGVTPGINYQAALDNLTAPTIDNRAPDLATQIKFFEYPWRLDQATAFGTPPDLLGRYRIGVDYAGQPFYETLYDRSPHDKNPATSTFYRSLLTDIPYELDLSSSQRRDSWASHTNALGAFVDANQEFSYSLNQNDDGPFSPTDLEKVLRGWDAETGSLPSRLWDVVNEFDPLKLINPLYGDPRRVEKVANDSLGSTNGSALLAAAQQIAGISRRLVTTDSFDLPVASQLMPDYVLELGPDGKPGVAAVDDDPDGAAGPLVPDGKTDDIQEIGALGTDDFLALTGTKYSEAKIVDLLRYRIQRERLNRGALAFVLTDPVFALITSQLTQQLLAPEVVAGQRIDLNRPFGDGRDSANPYFPTVFDGVVDDPYESGDPFVDVNGNGVWDANVNSNPEPFINADGSVDANDKATYTPPGDQLWSGLTAEAIGFDYTNGQGNPLNTVADASIVTTYAVPAGTARVRNLEAHGRQLYARQLYCLMLLLVDENYIAPWDENDPQITTWIEFQRARIESALTAASVPAAQAKPQADMIAKRKLTCRTIAQWAVNCVDMRDSDVIMTPFEYDENPYDGWGVWDRAQTNVIPLDGDPATNENGSETMAEAQLPAQNMAEVIIWKTDGTKTISNTDVDGPKTATDQTRGVVWGAERPELLITETLAYHERRAEDLISNDSNGHFEMEHYDNPGTNYQDADPDQGLRPRGTLMVEVQNPWSPDGQYPAELYTRLDGTTNYLAQLTPKPGVELGRVSNYAWDEANNRLTLEKTNAATGIKRSPIWKLTVVEEWPDSRNDDEEDEVRLDRVLAPAPFKQPKAYSDMTNKVKNWKPIPADPNPPFRPTDIDFEGTFDPNFLPKQKGVGQNLFEIQYPYVEREFYFTTDKSPEVPQASLKPTDIDQVIDYDFSPASFKLRIPYRGIAIQYPANTKQKPRVINTQKFIPWGLELSSLTEPVIAPIMPGRYGVIGSAGANYNLTSVLSQDAKDPNKQVYIATVGRMTSPSGSWNTDDKEHYPLQTRRIEMRPNKNPTVQQVVVGSNGGDPKDDHQPQLAGNIQYDPTTREIARDNELINNRGTVENLTTPDNSGNSKFYQPAVAIPVEGMNISEPPWGYSLSEVESAIFEAQKKIPPVAPTMLIFKKVPNLTTKNYEGRYYSSGVVGQNQSSYDKPFDGYPGHKTAPELLRNGTTANYRTIHLQRLANPMLPWNPAPGTFKDAASKDLYRSNMPINPYRTVDTSSVNLTAFNGASDSEAEYPSQALPNAMKDMLQQRPWNDDEYRDIIKLPNGTFTRGDQVFYFRSTERGDWSRLNVLGSNPTAPAVATSPPQRVLWSQEPALPRFKKPSLIGSVHSVYHLIPDRQMSMRAAEVPAAIKAPTAQNITKNRADMVMEHTLGFGNRSFGLLYDKQGAKQPGTPAGSNSSSAPPSPVTAAMGAPAPGDFVWDNDVDNDADNSKSDKTPDVRIPVKSTNPWLAWDNRPFVSANEILKVPMASQSQMLRAATVGPFPIGFSAIDPSIPAAQQRNPYDGMKLKNAERLAWLNAPFGFTTNFFATAQFVSDVIRDPATGNPIPDANGYWEFAGAPNFWRILDYVQVPSRYVGTETVLNAETFNNVPTYVAATEPIGAELIDGSDPRYFFQPPFNKVSRERDPGKINLNTITGRRAVVGGVPQIWSEVFDGIMHRFHDGHTAAQLGHSGPAWRDVVLSRRGYRDPLTPVPSLANGVPPLTTTDRTPDNIFPDVASSLLRPDYPTMFSNPFRSPDAGDLVPLANMVQPGVQVSLLRSHPYAPANPTLPIVGAAWGRDVDDPNTTPANERDDNGDGLIDDAREAGIRPTGNDPVSGNPYANDELMLNTGALSRIPLFGESASSSFIDGDRNPAMMYQPMTRLGNLVTNRSGVYAVWITVGYFEVEPAPNWNDPDATIQANVRAHFMGEINLYNRVYPDGYMLGKELGSETGDVKRPRGFYIIDRTEEVGFKPGEDLNVEKAFRLRRRIE